MLYTITKFNDKLNHLLKIIYRKTQEDKMNAIIARPPNSILFAGDPHGQFNQIRDAANIYKPKAIIILGDLALKIPLQDQLEGVPKETRMLWIPGNHDFGSVQEYECLFNASLADNNLHLNVIEVDGVKIAGLGGVFMGKVWRPDLTPRWKDKAEWRINQPSNIKKMPLKIEHAIWHDEVEQMMSSVKADILVTHEAPSCHKFGFRVIDKIASRIGAKHIIHGHHHRYYQDSVTYNKEKVKVTGVGLRAINDLNGKQLIN